MSRSGNKKTVVVVNTTRLQFDKKALVRDLRENIARVYQDAAIKFVQVAASNVPSLTGQAKAALIGIAEDLGLDCGVSPDDPPLSENMHLYYYLVGHGNTVERGKDMGSGEIKLARSPYFLRITLNVTAAHNGYHYFTHWDNEIWGSIDEAVNSMQRYIKENLKPPKLKFTKPQRKDL